MKIKNLKLKNFQKHKSLNLKFNPNLNVIVGSSSKGKSAIVKALAFVLLNQSKPSDVRHGARNTTVELDSIVRTRTKTGTGTYKIGDQIFEKLGRDVPHEVKKLFPLTDKNFIQQFNQHYFINLSPGERATVLYDLVGLSNINEVLSTAQDEVNELQLDKRYKEKYLLRLRRKKKIYEPIVKKIEEAELLDQKVSKLKSMRSIKIPPQVSLNVDLDEYKELRTKIRRLKEITAIKIPPKVSLNVDLDEYKKLAKQVRLLRKIANVRIPKPILFNDFEEYSQYKKKAKLLTQVQSTRKQLVGIEHKIYELTKEHEDLLHKLGKCPLCGSILK